MLIQKNSILLPLVFLGGCVMTQSPRPDALIVYRCDAVEKLCEDIIENMFSVNTQPLLKNILKGRQVYVFISPAPEIAQAIRIDDIDYPIEPLKIDPLETAFNIHREYKNRSLNIGNIDWVFIRDQIVTGDNITLCLAISHEFLHVLWLNGFVDKEAFGQAYHELLRDNDWKIEMAKIFRECSEDEEVREAFAWIGQMFLIRPSLPSYLLQFYSPLITHGFGLTEDRLAQELKRWPLRFQRRN